MRLLGGNFDPVCVSVLAQTSAPVVTKAFAHQGAMQLCSAQYGNTLEANFDSPVLLYWLQYISESKKALAQKNFAIMTAKNT